MKIAYALLLLLPVIKFTQSSKILAIVGIPAYSHQIAFQKVWSELSKRGHEVVVVTSDPIKDASLRNLTEIDTSYAYDLLRNTYDSAKVFKTLKNNPLKLLEKLTMFTYDLSDSLLSYAPILELVNGKDQHFDIVLVETYFPEMYSFGKVFKCPVIGILSMDATAAAHGKMANGDHPAVNPDLALPFYANLSFKERVISCIYKYFYNLYMNFRTLPMRQKLLNKHFKNNSESIFELIKNVDLYLYNSNPVLNGVRSLTPNVINFGGFNHIKEPEKLPNDLELFLNKSKNGVIYFSLGSNLKSEAMDPNMIETILNTFRQLPFNVLWKFESDYLPNQPETVKVIKWAPQQDILRHSNIKLFITQGGLQSLDEAIFTHVPVLVMPFFGDQAHNAKLVEHKKLGLTLNPHNLESKQFADAINEIILNPMYKKSMENIARLIKDQPMSGVEKAIWWIEYVIRNKGAKELRNPLIGLPFYQYYMLDILSLILFVILTVIYLTVIFYRIFKKMFALALYQTRIKSKTS